MRLLVPKSPFENLPDAHFAAEAEASEVFVVHADEQIDGHCLPMGAVEPDEYAYRGWMRTPEAYTDLYEAALARGIELLTDPDRYARAHVLPGWYSQFTGLTPASAWRADTSVEALIDAYDALGAPVVIVKDFTRSAKHLLGRGVARDHDELRAIHAAMSEQNDIAGGWVVRAFKQLIGVEVRTWWRQGELRLVSAHPDTPGERPSYADLPVGEIGARLRSLDLDFVTVDCSRDAEGDWRVVEVGDGGVSDRPRSIDAARFLSAIS